MASNFSSLHINLQKINSPDMDLDRDIIEGDTILGMEAGELTTTDKRFQVNISTIVLSALIFLAILAWFDFIQTTFYYLLAPQSPDPVPPPVKLWYAIFITLFVFILVVLTF